MKYTGPKFKLCRREWVNIFWAKKYDVKKNRALPGQHGANMQRHSEYGKLLRNKQLLKRTYFLSEKQFGNIVKKIASKFSKNNEISHDAALFRFLESRLDTIIYRAGFAKSIIQARQMVGHGHFLVNGKKHNIPSTFVKAGDKIQVKDKLKTSPLYGAIGLDKTVKEATWLKVDKNTFAIEILGEPKMGEFWQQADLLKVIEFYARA